MIARTILTAVAACIVAAITTTALAASIAKAPKTMVLQKSDFPAGARRTANYGEATGHLVTYRYKTGSKENELSSYVILLPSRKLADLAFKEARTDVTKWIWKVSLPKYGDEQFASFHPLEDGQLIVRKGNTVWGLMLLGVVGDRTLTKADATAEFKRYGPKAMKRAGSG